jgi:hypothetical protein
MKLSEALSTVDSPAGRKRLADYLARQPFPHYEAVPGRPDLLLRIEADGTRTVGRFVDGEFQQVTGIEVHTDQASPKDTSGCNE